MGPTPAGLGVVIRCSRHKNHGGVHVKAHVNDPADRLDASTLAMQLAADICRRLDLEDVAFHDNQSLVTTLQAHGNSARRWVVKIPRSANKKAHNLAKQARQSLAGKACEFTCNNKSHAGSCPVLQALQSGQWEEGFSLVSVLCFWLKRTTWGWGPHVVLGWDRMLLDSHHRAAIPRLQIYLNFFFEAKK